MTTQLTLWYTVCSCVLLAAGGAMLYWALARSLQRQNVEFLGHKMQVLEWILARQPLDMAGLEQEVRDEAEVAARSRSPYLLRVLDARGRLIAETPGMGRPLARSLFPGSQGGSMRQLNRRLDGRRFLLASVRTPVPGSGMWRLQAALDTTADEQLLARYRLDVLVILGVGMAVAAALGATISRRGLRALTSITRTVKRIGAQQLQERLQPGAWPRELAALASEFDRMLERLQESFLRLSQFSSDLAHELRTPLHNLMGETQVALSRERAASEYARVLQSALEEQQRLTRIIDSMLFLAQADQARLQLAAVPLQARVELEAIAEFYQALADEQGVELRCDGDAALRADAPLLRRALSNLVANALKWTPRGGTVTLSAGASEGGAGSLSVVDNGVGVAAEHLPRLGDRFYRVDAARGEGGVGLGLAIVRSIMALHGGTLSIQSRPGEGTRATLLFPPVLPGGGDHRQDDSAVMLSSPATQAV